MNRVPLPLIYLLLGVVLACLMGLVFVMRPVISPHIVPKIQIFRLRFVPQRWVLPTDVARLHRTKVRLCNDSEKDITVDVDTCCGVSVEPNRNVRVPSRGCVTLHLTTQPAADRNYRGAIFVHARGTQSPIAMLPIVGDVRESILSSPTHTISLPALVRKSPDASSKVVCATLAVDPPFEVVGLTAAATWLQVWYQHRDTQAVVCAQSLPYAREGVFQVPLVVRYRTKQGRTGEDILTLEGEITSIVQAYPERLFFGVLQHGKQVVTKELTIWTKTYQNKPVSVRLDSPLFSANVRPSAPHAWKVTVSFSPLRKGQVTGELRAYVDGQLLCKVPLSAYVQ